MNPKNLKSLTIAAATLTATVASSIFLPVPTKAQTGPCDWFTGIYRDAGRGIVVHLGAGELAVYNGNPTPLRGRCIDSENIQVNFPGRVLNGRKTRNAPEIAWSNGTVWRRESSSVTFPLPGF